MIQYTSLAAWEIALAKVGRSQKAVLDMLRTMDDATNAELGYRMGWPINRVTPRVNELRKIGLVLDIGRRTCKITANAAHAWKAKYPVLPPAFDKVEEKPQPML
jgi:hypothetical protein